jgi:hypothetical protein
MYMTKYVYQIKGTLENSDGKFQGFRVLVCNADNLESVDIPANILDKETIQYLQFRLMCTTSKMNMANLPYAIQNKIRTPLGRWLDNWVLKNFYGNNSKSKSTNP